MATLTQEEIVQKKRLLKEKMEEMHAIEVELVEAGAFPLDDELDDDELDGVAGGTRCGQGPGKDVVVLHGCTDGVHLFR